MEKEKRMEKGRRVQGLQETLVDRKKADDEERDRVRKRREQEARDAEMERCPISVPKSGPVDVAGPCRGSEMPLHTVRTHSQTQVVSRSAIVESPQDPGAEITALKAEVVQLREDLASRKARLKDFEDERDEAKKQQQAAASLDAQDEVARLRRRVENLDKLLDQTTTELKRLRAQLHDSEDRIEELEDEVRILKKRSSRQTHEENQTPSDSTETAQSHGPQDVVLQEKPRKLSTAKKSHGLDPKTFLVSCTGPKNKTIRRLKGGTVPIGIW